MRYTLIFIFILFVASGAYAENVSESSICDIPQLTSPFSNPFHAGPNAIVAEKLGWKSAINLCGGAFVEPAYISSVPNPAPIDSALTMITSTGLSTFSQTGVSTLEGNVDVTQPGREVTAEKVILYRNQQTGKINLIDLSGNVSYREAGKLLVGESAELNVEQKTLTVSEGAYQITRPDKKGTTMHGWGILKRAFREASGTLHLDKTTYSTCSPTDPTWFLKADRLVLNKQTGRGTARDAWLYGAGVPLFYTPYANFPIDNRRYSGFLYPSFEIDENSGLIVNIPYYFNLAPNYDDTLTASPMTNRGLQMSNLFRYLDPINEASLMLSYLPSDREFASFKNTILQDFPPGPGNDPYLSELNNDSNNRAALTFHDKSTFGPKWSGGIDLNYVSDDYYLQDFGSGAQAVTTDQLLNQAELKYQNEHWQFLGRVQAYQTLHDIKETFVQDQYSRAPQLDLNASYLDQPFHLDYAFNSEWVNFQHVDDFFSDEPFPTGNRVHFSPQVKRPWIYSYGYFTPALALDLTSYNIANNGVIEPNVVTCPDGSVSMVCPDVDNPDLNRLRTLPIFNIDTGLYFDRNFSLGKYALKQTLEPRLFYLYVPEKNQNDIPIFDTTLPAFNYDQMFLTNRFAGYDRVGDANQISWGLTSRILDGFSGATKLRASIGEILYFQHPTVCLYPDCIDSPSTEGSVSPISALLSFTPNPKWTATASAAWDPVQSAWNNAAGAVTFSPKPQHILKLGYNYVQNGDVINTDLDSSANNLQRIDAGVAWPITRRWSAVADYNYNISHNNPQTYLYGLQYDSCCWAVRFVTNRILTAQNVDGNEFRNTVYIQFLFKGLGSIGNNDAGTVLSTIPGYQDIFRG